MLLPRDNPLFSRRHPVTSGLLLANGLMYAAILWAGGPGDLGVLIRFGALVRHRVWEGEYWRLISPLFVHGSFVHFALNALALYILGRLVEPFLGSGRFSLLYFVSGLGGSIGSLLFTPSISVGASGAIFGLLGAMLAAEYIATGSVRHLLASVTRGSVLPIIALELLLGVMVPVVDNAAHVGGLVAGCALGYYLATRRYMRVEHWTRSTAALSAFVVVAAVGLALGARPPRDPAKRYGAAGLEWLMTDAASGQAIPYLESAARLEPTRLDNWVALAEACLRRVPPDLSRALKAARRARRLPCPRRAIEKRLAGLEGACLVELHRPEEAVRVFASAIETFPDAQEFRTSAAVCLLDLGRFGEAMVWAEAGLKRFPRDVSCYHTIEQACRALGRTEEAERAHEFIRAYYEREYRTNPDAVNANNLSWTYAEGEEELDEALRLALEATEDAPGSRHRLDTLAWVHYKRGDLPAAIKTFEQAIEIDDKAERGPEAHYAHYHLAVVLAKARRHQEALAHVRRALSIRRVYDERWAAQALARELEQHLGIRASDS